MSNICGGHGNVCCNEGFREHEPAVMVHDPVCGKKLDCESKGVQQLNWNDAVFYFCDTRCMTKFVKNPKKYVGKKGFLSFLKWW